MKSLAPQPDTPIDFRSLKHMLSIPAHLLSVWKFWLRSLSDLGEIAGKRIKIRYEFGSNVSRVAPLYESALMITFYV